MNEVPLRVDFAGGWLDVPQFYRAGAFIVNCTFTPGVTKDNWPYNFGGGLGGSAAKSILDGIDPIESELKAGVGWQDPAVIKERGLCVWRSGVRPVLECKYNPDWITSHFYLFWTGKQHITADLLTLPRSYVSIEHAGRLATKAVKQQDLFLLYQSIRWTYLTVQINEGMDRLPDFGEACKKYCGSGHGGYALYVNPQENKENMIRINLMI